LYQQQDAALQVQPRLPKLRLFVVDEASGGFFMRAAAAKNIKKLFNIRNRS
jgi:hypothetical protein